MNLQLREETSVLGTRSGRSDSSSFADDTTTTTTISSWSTAATIRRSNVNKTDKTMVGSYEEAKSQIYSFLKMHCSKVAVTGLLQHELFVLNMRRLVIGHVDNNISDEQITQIGEEYVHEKSIPGFVGKGRDAPRVESSLTRSSLGEATASRNQVQSQAACSDRTNTSIATFIMSTTDAEKAVSTETE